MVDYNGSIFTQIPKSIVNGDTTEKITGMTLNNYVWDDVHRDYNGKDQKVIMHRHTTTMILLR